LSQLSGDSAIFRLNQLVMPPGSIGVELSPLQALLPQGIELGPVLLQMSGGGQGQV
jgi:hypothetical protein